jgi:hypothetical protein
MLRQTSIPAAYPVKVQNHNATTANTISIVFNLNLGMAALRDINNLVVPAAAAAPDAIINARVPIIRKPARTFASC